MTHISDEAVALLPCPFCGGKADYFANGSLSQPDIIVHRVLCNCEMQPFTDWRATKSEAIAAWNRRAALSAAAPHMAGEPVAWRCAECGCLTFARVDERGADGHFHPGSNVRCVNCKRVSYWPDPAPPSSGLMEEVAAALQGMLRHSCVADSAPEDKDAEDHDAERAAARAIEKIRGKE